MDEQEKIIKEYEDLRNEIKQKIELHNSLITFMITAVITILAFALEGNSTLLYLLPFGIIILIAMRVTYYRTAMIKLTAYIIVYLETKIEELNWETRNFKLINKDENKFFDIITISHYYEGMALGIICYGLYVRDYISDKTMNFQTILFLIVPFFLVAWEIIITIRIVHFNKEKEEYIKKWENFKNNNE